MDRTDHTPEEQTPFEYIEIYAGDDMRDLSGGEFIAAFAQPQLVTEYVRELFESRKFKGHFIFIAKRNGARPVLSRDNLGTIIASSGEVLMADGKMLDY